MNVIKRILTGAAILAWVCALVYVAAATGVYGLIALWVLFMCWLIGDVILS